MLLGVRGKLWRDVKTQQIPGARRWSVLAQPYLDYWLHPRNRRLDVFFVQVCNVCLRTLPVCRVACPTTRLSCSSDPPACFVGLACAAARPRPHPLNHVALTRPARSLLRQQSECRCSLLPPGAADLLMDRTEHYIQEIGHAWMCQVTRHPAIIKSMVQARHVGTHASASAIAHPGAA